MIKINNKKQFDDIVSGSGTILVDFFATWCPPCKKLTPILEKLSTELPDVIFLKVDVDAQQDISESYNITSMPTMLIIRDGKVLSKKVGYYPEAQVKNWIISKN